MFWAHQFGLCCSPVLPGSRTALSASPPLAERAPGHPGSGPGRGRALWTTLFWSNVGQKSFPGISSSFIFSGVMVLRLLAYACP